MYALNQEDKSHIALAALHRQMVTRVCQLEELAARYDALGRYGKIKSAFLCKAVFCQASKLSGFW